MALAPSSTSLPSLTPREREVAALVSAGVSHKAVARTLGIKVRTVSLHVWNAAQKLPGDGRPSLKIARCSHLFAASDNEPTAA